jgi:hypothetical protein
MRSRADMINDDNYYMYMIDIGEDIIINKIIDTLRDIYTANFKIVPEPNFLAYNLLSVNMFYDTRINRLYITYRLDDARSVGLHNVYDSQIYNKILDKLNMVSKEQDIRVSVIGTPTALPQDSLNRSYGIIRHDQFHLRADTEYMWTIEQGPYNDRYRTYFIENTNKLKDNISKNRTKPEDINEYFNKVNRINQKFINDKTEINYKKAFKEYSKLYKSYFNDTPKEVEEWRVISIYIDVTHDVEKEKLQPFEHDRGHIIYPERVKEYIRQWAIDHGKEVPII